MAVMAVMAVCIAIAGLAACGDGAENGSDDQEDPARLGCGEFCQQAGGIGDGSSGMKMLTIDVGDSVEFGVCVYELPARMRAQFLADRGPGAKGVG